MVIWGLTKCYPSESVCILLPVLVDDDALAVLGVEAAGDAHVQLEAGPRHVHHRPAQHVAVLGGERQGQVGADWKPFTLILEVILANQLGEIRLMTN